MNNSTCLVVVTESLKNQQRLDEITRIVGVRVHVVDSDTHRRDGDSMLPTVRLLRRNLPLNLRNMTEDNISKGDGNAEDSCEDATRVRNGSTVTDLFGDTQNKDAHSDFEAQVDMVNGAGFEVISDFEGTKLDDDTTLAAIFTSPETIQLFDEEDTIGFEGCNCGLFHSLAHGEKSDLEGIEMNVVDNANVVFTAPGTKELFDEEDTTAIKVCNCGLFHPLTHEEKSDLKGFETNAADNALVVISDNNAIVILSKDEGDDMVMQDKLKTTIMSPIPTITPPSTADASRGGGSSYHSNRLLPKVPSIAILQNVDVPNVRIHTSRPPGSLTFTPLQKWEYENGFRVDGVTNVRQWAIEVGLEAASNDPEVQRKRKKIHCASGPPKYCINAPFKLPLPEKEGETSKAPTDSPDRAEDDVPFSRKGKEKAK